MIAVEAATPACLACWVSAAPHVTNVITIDGSIKTSCQYTVGKEDRMRKKMIRTRVLGRSKPLHHTSSNFVEGIFVRTGGGECSHCRYSFSKRSNQAWN
jgi:hypothetical protein